MSLRTGGEIASISAPIINPDNLKIEGFYCEDRYDKKQLVLLFQDIREILRMKADVHKGSLVPSRNRVLLIAIRFVVFQHLQRALLD